MNEPYLPVDAAPPVAPPSATSTSRPISIIVPLLLTIGIIAAVVVDVARRWGDEDYGPLPTGVACRPISSESRCFDPAPDTVGAFTDAGTCRAGGVCLVPMGNVSLWLVEAVRDKLSSDLGLDVVALPPVPIAREDFVPSRRGVPASGLLRTLQDSYGRGCCDGRAVFIGLTSISMHSTTFGGASLASRRALGQGTFLDVISTYELSSSDRDLLVDRVVKVSSRYIGLDYFELKPTQNSNSPLYSGPDPSIYQLDQMGHLHRRADGHIVLTTR